MPKKKSYLTVTDQFCGAGGSSLGAEYVGMDVYLALNHWQLAIDTHNTNFPNTHHDCADVSATDPRRYASTDILVTSPECTNHSVAKGAARRRKQLHLWEKEVIDPSAERSRATMWDVPRFAEYHDYNVIVAENVVDARHWIMWDAWILAMDKLGYDYHIVYLNSQFAHLDPRTVRTTHDFAPQSRDRMYVVFWKKVNKRPNLDFRPLAPCSTCCRDVEAVQGWKQTPAVRKTGGRWGRYGDQYIYCCPTCANEVMPYHFAAANAIDWSLPAERIGDRKRPLKEKTINRIRKGLEKFGNQYLMIELRNGQDARQLSEAMSTIATSGAHHGLMMPYLINTLHGGGATAVSDSLATQTARQSHALVMPNAFLTSINDYDDRNIQVGDPMGTQTTQNKFGLTMAPFMVELRGTNTPKGVDEAMSTVAANGNHHGLLLPAPFLMSYYGTENNRGVDEAMGTLTAVDRHGVVMPFFIGYANGEGPAHNVTDPLLTIHTENGHGLIQPTAEISVEDCYFRMLQPPEIGKGMAFPGTYVVLGNKREQVKQYGNAVTPIAMRQILGRVAETFQ